MDKFQDIYRIPSARLQTWDYGWDAAYFITICTAGHEHYFGEIVNGKMQLSNVGVLADVFWYEIKNHAKHVELGEFVVMPNHIHGILILNGNEPNTHDNPGSIDESNRNEDDNNMDVNGNNVNDEMDVNGMDGIDGIDVETRHALSLQSIQSTQSNQSPPTPGEQRFRNQGKNTVSSIVGSYKSVVTKHANRLGFAFGWQERFHDHIIRDEAEYQRIAHYIANNPANWKDDKFNKENGHNG